MDPAGANNSIISCSLHIVYLWALYHINFKTSSPPPGIHEILKRSSQEMQAGRRKREERTALQKFSSTPAGTAVCRPCQTVKATPHNWVCESPPSFCRIARCCPKFRSPAGGVRLRTYIYSSNEYSCRRIPGTNAHITGEYPYIHKFNEKSW